MKIYCTISTLVLSLIFVANGWCAPLEITRDYTSSADLNDALTAGGYDSISNSGTYTIALTGTSDGGTSGVPINANCMTIDVNGGKLTITPTGSMGGGATACLFAGTINVATGAELYFGAQDAIGTKNGQAVTFNIHGTWSLIDGKNQTLRGTALNLYDGSLVTGGKIDYRLNSFAIYAKEGSSTIASQVNMRADATTAFFEVAEGATLNMNGVISQESGSMSFRKTGAGVLVFGGSNTYMGTTKLEAGTIQLGKTNAIAASSVGLEAKADTYFQMNGFDQSLKTLTGSGNVQNRAATDSVLTINATGDSTFSGRIGESGNLNGTYGKLTVVKIGDQTWTIQNPGGSWGTDSLRVDAGTLKLVGVVTRFATQFDVNAGGTLDFASADTLKSSGDAVTINVNKGGTLKAIAGENQTTRNMTFNFTGATVESGLFLSMTSSQFLVHASDTTTTFGAELALREMPTVGTFVVEDGAAAVDLDITGVIGNYFGAKGNLKIVGPGVVRLSAVNTYTGTTEVTEGTLQLGHVDALKTTSSLTLGASAKFDLNGYDQEWNATNFNQESLGGIVNSQAGTQQSTLTFNVSDTFAYKGAIGNGIDIVKTGAGTWTINTEARWGANSLTVAEGTVIKNGTSAVRFVAGDITIADGAKMVWNARDAVGASSSQTGTRNVNVFGELELFSAQTSRYSSYNLYGGTIIGKYSTTLDDCGRIMMVTEGPTALIAKATNPDGSEITRSSVYDGILAIRNTTDGKITVEDSAASVDLLWKNAQYLTGNLLDGTNAKLTKFGAGVLKIQDGNLKNTQGLNIEEGRLVLDNTKVTASTVTISDGASLFGTNGSVISGTLALNGNYVVQLADIAGTPMSVGTVTFGENASFELDTTGVNIADFNEIPIFNVTDPGSQQAVYAQLAEMLKDSAWSQVVLLEQINGAMVLNVDRNAVPEPATWLLLALGLGWVLRKRFWGTKS